MLCGVSEKSYVRKCKRIVVLQKDPNGNSKEKTPRQIIVTSIKLKRVKRTFLLAGAK
jgi:hypothetical protein